MTALALLPARETVTCGELDVAFRAAGPADEGVVMRGWLTGHQDTGDWPRFVAKGRYFAIHKPVVQRLVADCSTMMACNPKRPGQVLGFITWKSDVLHWLYVKQFLRGNKIASALWRKAGRPTECSHWTLASQRLAGRWWLRYNPFLLGDS